MARWTTTLVLVTTLLGAGSLCAQDTVSFQTRKLADGLYELSMDAGGYPDKVIASVGPDGLLVVDTAERETGKELGAALQALGKGLPKIIINTHSHIEHLGGNPEVGRSAVIISHRNLRERYVNGLYAFGDYPVSALPNLTFADTLTLHFNGEEIRLASFIGAHDDSDIAVWFTRSKVAVVGAICMGTHFPSIDGDTSDIRTYPAVTERLLAWLPEDVTLVPGHADNCTMAEGRRFLEMLRKTSEIVRAEIAKGRSLDRLVADDVLAGYKSYESSYVKRQDWIAYWHDAFTNPRPTQPKPWGPVHAALVEKGAAAAVDRYTELKRARPGDYSFADTDLFIMGRRLGRIGRHADAVAFLERCLVEYPGSQGANLAHNTLANSYEKLGQLDKARTHLAKYIEAFPKDEAARKRLAGLDAKLQRR